MAVLFLFTWFSCAWFGSWEGNPNNATRLFAAVSMAEDGDATIDEFAALTIDKARFGNHYYLDKAPGMTLMALPAVALADAATGVRARDVPLAAGDPRLSRWLLERQWLAAATGPALLTALAAVLLFDLGLALTGSAAAALFGALAYALGTPVWGWSTTLFGHAAVAALYVVAVWAVWRLGDREPRVGHTALARAALAGAALGWAVVVEYQAVLAGGVVALWALARTWRRPDRWRLWVAGAAAGLAALLPLLAYNLLAFGTPFRLGYQGVVGFEGMGRGLFGLTWPSPRVLAMLLFNPRRGLLWVAPVLLLAPRGLALLRGHAPGLARVGAAAAAVVLLVNAAYFYWDGGNSTGPRHATPAVAFLCLGLASRWAALEGWGRRAAAALLAASMGWNLLIAAADVMAPPNWPLWTVVWTTRFSRGDVRTVGSSLLGWSPWTGLAVYLAVAALALGWLVRDVKD